MAEGKASVHVFVVPDLKGPVTGGTLFNRMLIASLEAMNVACRVCSTGSVWPQLPRVDADDVLWVDSLFLDLIPTLTRAARRRARLGLLLHYLPSLLARGDLIEAPDLTPAEREALAAADVVLVPSPYMRGIVERLASPAPPIIVLEPGRLAVGRAPPRDRRLRAVMVANLVPGKGIWPFLACLAERARPADDFQIDIVGSLALDVEYGQACRRAARDPRLAGRVHFLGECSPDSTVEHMATCNLFLSASSMESYGMALAEARGLGLPIAAVRGGNVEFLVEERAGGEVLGDVPALAQAFVRLSRDANVLRERLDAARAHALPPRPWSMAAAEFVERIAAIPKAWHASHTQESKDVDRLRVG